MAPLRIAVAMIGLLLVAAQPATAAEWTVKPAPNHFGADRQDYRYTIDPGGQAEDGIVVVNHGTSLLHLTLRGIGAWARPDQGDLTIPAGQTVQVPFTVAPPADAEPGDHAGAIITTGTGGKVALPIRLRVGGALKPRLATDDVRVRYSGTLGTGDATVTYTIRNTGNATLGAHQTVLVSGPFGRWKVKAGNVADSPALLPGATRKLTVALHGVVPALRLTATVTLVPLLTDASGSIAPLAATKTSGHGWAVPWSLLVAIVVLGGLVLLLRRRAHAMAGDAG